LLKDLGINFKIKGIDNGLQKQNVTMRQFIDESQLTLRTINRLYKFINYNLDMHIADFVRNYSVLEFSRERNVGVCTTTELKFALAEFGYDW
jgi:hypothetical protein